MINNSTQNMTITEDNIFQGQLAISLFHQIVQPYRNVGSYILLDGQVSFKSGGAVSCSACLSCCICVCGGRLIGRLWFGLASLGTTSGPLPSRLSLCP